MALAGNTRELSLADLILVKAHDPGSYRLRLTGPAGDGLLVIRGGRIVHAAYGELPAADAAYLLVTEEGVDFEVESEVEIQGHTLNLTAQELLLESMRRFDEGILKRPKRIAIGVGTQVQRREPPRPRSRDSKRSPEAEALRRATGSVLFAEPEPAMSRVKKRSRALLWILPLGALVVAGLLTAGQRMGWVSSQEYRDPVGVSDLDGPRDVLPVLLHGGPGVAPPDANVLPTIVYRILVDSEGAVHPERPQQRRDGLEAFEAAAAEALKSYRFSPALREGIPVPVRLNWPVDFVRRTQPSPTPVPVDAAYFDEINDTLPALVEGEPPANPLPGRRRIPPKILCRILVDVEGGVAEASVVDSQAQLAPYESAALEAVRSYRFTPGRREKVLVPTRMDWPIEFR
jgi:TonB family protein